MGGTRDLWPTDGGRGRPLHLFNILLSFSLSQHSSTFLRTSTQQLIKKPQDVWTLASKHVRVHQEKLWTGEMEADTGKDGNQRGKFWSGRHLSRGPNPQNGEDGDEIAGDEGRGVLRRDGHLLCHLGHRPWVRLDAAEHWQEVQGLLHQPGQLARLSQVHVPAHEGSLLLHRR